MITSEHIIIELIPALTFTLRMTAFFVLCSFAAIAGRNHKLSAIFMALAFVTSLLSVIISVIDFFFM